MLSDYQGQGLGTALVAAAATWAQSRGYRRLLTSTSTANEAMQRTARRLGFRIAGRWAHLLGPVSPGARTIRPGGKPMTSRKKGMKIIAGAGVGAAAAAALRRRWAGRRGAEVPAVPEPGSAGDRYLERLAAAVRLATISNEDRSRTDPAPFAAFHAFLEETYPLVHQNLGREVVAEHSLLYTWEGADPSAPAVLLMGHMDVVEIEPGTEGNWADPPFAGERDEEFLWGRGTLDDKCSVMAIFEAVEDLLAEGFRPDVTLYLAFGHDEEIGGGQGTASISALLASRRVRLDFVVDEGGAVVTGLLPGVTRPVALVGIGEKGYLNVELIADGAGGHSSVPPPHTAVGRWRRRWPVWRPPRCPPAWTLRPGSSPPWPR